MTEFLQGLEALGAASVARLWAPVAAWTVVALGLEAALGLWGGRAPAVAYRLAQAVLLALPVGLAVALLIDPAWLPSWGAPRLVPLPVGGASTPASDVPVALPAALPAVTWRTVAGVATLAAGLLGALGLARLAVQAARVGRLRRALPSVEAPGLEADVQAAAARVGLRRAPAVLVTSADVVPMTLGVARPVVVLPAGLEASERRLALAHEFLHVRQGDVAAHGLEALAAAAFAAHPLAARLARRCDLFREMACDAAVLAQPGADRRSYAALVSSFATATRPRWSAAVGMAARTSHVHQRLLAMTRPPSSPAPRLAALLAVAAFAVGALVMTAGRAVAQPAPHVLVEGVGDARIYVDGVEVEGPLESLDLAPGDIYTVDVRRGDAVVTEHGVEAIVRITTRARAEADGLPAIPSGAPGLDGDRETIAFRVKTDGQTETLHASPTGHVVRLRVERDGEPVEIEPEGEAQMVVLRRRGDGDGPDPLVLVDGAPVPGGVEALDDLDPTSIASIDVMKGDRAVEEYGAAAAGGVVRITTKSAVGAAPKAGLEAPTPAAFSVVGARPNPAQDRVEIALAVPEAGPVRVEVFDATGRLVRTVTRDLAAGAGAVGLDVSDLAAGTYAVRATAEADGRRVEASTTVTIAR